MKNILFYTSLLVFVGLICGLGFFPTVWENDPISHYFALQIICLFSSYTLLGIGLGIPFALLALALSWLQLILLISGKLNPHLSNAGLTHALKMIFMRL